MGCLTIQIIVIEIWDEQPIVRIALKLSIDLGELRKRTNVNGRGEAAKNPFSVEIRLM